MREINWITKKIVLFKYNLKGTTVTGINKGFKGSNINLKEG